MFYRRDTGRYVVVYPPFGLRLRHRPNVCHIVRYRSDDYCYHYGTYYHWEPELRVYIVVRPPEGLYVNYLPDDYYEFYHHGVRYYRYGEIYYRPRYRSGVIVYFTVHLDL